MHILHVIRSLHPEYGGPAQLVRCIVAAGPRLGWEGEVACLDESSEDFLGEITFPVHALGQGKGTTATPAHGFHGCVRILIASTES